MFDVKIPTRLGKKVKALSINSICVYISRTVLESYLVLKKLKDNDAYEARRNAG